MNIIFFLVITLLLYIDPHILHCNSTDYFLNPLLIFLLLLWFSNTLCLWFIIIFHYYLQILTAKEVQGVCLLWLRSHMCCIPTNQKLEVISQFQTPSYISTS